MKEKQEAPTTTTRNSFDGDGRDERYWEVRKYLLSCPSTQTLLKNAGPDTEMILEILVNAHLIGTKDGSCFSKRSREIIDEAIPLITAELDQEEKSNLISTTKLEPDEANHK